MKTLIYKTLVILLGFLTIHESYGQDRRVNETFTWRYEVEKDVTLEFNNYDCDLIIHTWDKPEIEYEMSLDVTLRSSREAESFEDYINNLEFKRSPEGISFDNRFWESRNNIMGFKTIRLKGRNVFRYSEFMMKGVLWIPEECNLNFTSKYSGIEVENMKGKIKLDLYNDDFYGADVNEDINIEAKYSRLEFDNMKNIEADLYNSSLEAGDIGDLTVTSKYSTFRVGDARELDIDSYNDNFLFHNTGDIRFVDKYSGFEADVTGNIEIDCYSSNMTLESAGDVEMESKYSTYDITSSDNCTLLSSYSDGFNIGTLKKLNIHETKYGSYKIDELTDSFTIESGYSDKFMVRKTGPGFDGLKVEGKYQDIDIAVPRELQYRFKADISYPDLDVNENDMDVRIKIQESSHLEMEAVKGEEKNDMAEFIIIGYDMSVTVDEY